MRVRLGIVFVAVASVVAVVVIVLASRNVDGLTAAIDVLEDDGDFASARASGDAFARVGGLLLDEGRSCRSAHDEPPARCAALLAGSGYAQVVAVPALRCPLPAIHEARTGLLAYLREVQELPPNAEDPPQIPAVPSCR